MPVLQINRCPNCGILSNHYDFTDQPKDWITVAVINEKLETLCSWNCVVEYAKAQAANQANDEASRAE